MKKLASLAEAAAIAQFRLTIIAPVIHELYPDSSRNAYYERITEKPFTLPDSSTVWYSPNTISGWVSKYQRGGIDALMPTERSDKGATRALPDTAIEKIHRLKQAFPRLNATQIHRPQSGQWLDECFFNRVMRKVNKDSTVSIDKVSYDVPMQFISMKVDIRFLPDDMSSAYILYNGVHYHIRRTDRNENCRTRRDNPPRVDYAKLGAGERK